MKKAYYLVLFMFPALIAIGQTNPQPPTPASEKPIPPPSSQEDVIVREYRDMVAVGFGLGQEYGGLGINVIVYPQKNIGLFAGYGYALAGGGYNAGFKLRLIPETRFMKISPWMTGMYGYNAAVVVADKEEYNKLFYGPSAGGGIDLRFRRNRGYMSFGIIIPFRDAEVGEYMDMLEQTKNVDFGTGLTPFTISIGYKLIIT